MLISFKRSHSSFRFRTAGFISDINRGFTLVELLVSISILLIIISVVVFRFASFDSAILLRTLAYDIGLSVREAQSYSLSSLGNQGNFRTPYGVSFTPGGTSYVFFGYTGSQTIPRYDTDVVVVDLYTLGRSFEITDVCVVANGVEDCGIASLDISFRRPEFIALFYVPSYSGNLADIESGIIKVASTRNNVITGIIEVTYTGQIDVSVE